jgi:hypothetical protein
MAKAYVFAACDIAYSSFYIHGLQQVLGKRNVHYNFNKFPPFKQATLAIIFVSKDKVVKKIAIDFTDGDEYMQDALEWCDVYGKININEKKIPLANYNKVTPIGPGFGIRLINNYSFVILAAINYLKSRKVITNTRWHFSNYLSQFKHRLPLSEYQNTGVNKNFLFFLSTIWKNEPQTNRFRANFIEAARSLPNVVFEGGFAPRIKNPVPGFEAMTVSSRYAFKTYLEKTSASFAVFNTAAVLDCHGWKLGEFLMMGKAIISTPITRLLPAPLIHGQHIHITDGSKEEILIALKMIQENEAYRLLLEKNAFDYYENYVNPTTVINKLINHPA